MLYSRKGKVIFKTKIHNKLNVAVIFFCKVVQNFVYEHSFTNLFCFILLGVEKLTLKDKQINFLFSSNLLL